MASGVGLRSAIVVVVHLDANGVGSRTLGCAMKCTKASREIDSSALSCYMLLWHACCIVHRVGMTERNRSNGGQTDEAQSKRRPMALCLRSGARGSPRLLHEEGASMALVTIV